MPARYNVPVPTTVFECYGAQLREASGEDFSTLVDSGRLTITISADKDPIIQVDNLALSWTGKYKKIDRKDFMLNTTDLMTFTYVTLPDSLSDAQYKHFEDVLHALQEGSVVPKPPHGDVSPTAAPAVAPFASHYPDVPSSSGAHGAPPMYGAPPVGQAASHGFFEDTTTSAHAPPPPSAYASAQAPPTKGFFDDTPPPIPTAQDAAAFQHAPPPATAATHKHERDNQVDHSFFGQVGAIGSVLQCVAQKAAFDTAKLGQAFRDRAEQDAKRNQEQNRYGYAPI